MIRRFYLWLTAPLPGQFRARGTPTRFRKKVQMTHQNTRVYEGSVSTADQLFNGGRQWAPYLVYHDWRVEWAGISYLVQQKDWPRKFSFRQGQSYTGWIDPDDLSSIWIMDGEHKCQLWIDEEEDDEEEGPLVAVDVHYDGDTATAAAVMFHSWRAPTPHADLTVRVKDVEPYESGAFYKRELPCIRVLLTEMRLPPALIIIDGYVTLGAEGRDGLGMHLFRALDGKVPVIGVAKTAYDGTPDSAELLRGTSRQPLYITAAGMTLEDAKTCISNMHGDHRIPTMLRVVDKLARTRGDIC